MTKKDYIQFANLMRSTLTYIVIDKYNVSKVYHNILSGMIEIFQKDNFKFDDDRFIKEITKYHKLP